MIETSVKVFSSGYSGAPTLNNTAGAMIAVLDSCLVNGFGLQTATSITVSSGVGLATFPSNMVCNIGTVLSFSGATGSYLDLNGERKVTAAASANVVQFDASGLPDGTVTGTVAAKFAAAGWLKAFTGTNKAAYKSSNAQASGMYLRVDDTTTTYASVRGYETMTGIDTYTGAFPTTGQVVTSAFPKSNDASAKNWFIFANDKAAYLWIAPTASYPNSYFCFMFGDIISRKSGDAYRFALFASNQDTSSAGSNSGAYGYQPILCTTSTYVARYLSRSYSAIASPVSVTTSWLNSSSGTMSGYHGGTFPNPADNGILTTPIILSEGSGYRGEMPGMLATPQAIGGGLAHGTVLENMTPLNTTLMWQASAYNASNGYGGAFMDIIGPWGN